MVSHHIRGKKPQPLRKHPAVLPKSRHPIRRQMKQNRPHIPRQKTGRINIRRNLFLHSQLQTGLDSLHPPLSRRHIPQRQIRIPIQNTRRKPQLNNPAGQIPPRDLTTLLSPPRKIKKLSPRNIPQIHIHKPLNNLPSPPRLKRRIQKRQNHIITQTTHSPSKTQAAPKRPPSKPDQHKPPKPFTQATSTHIRSPSHIPHQHTSEAHLSSHISVHPKLFSQVTSAYIRSSSLKSHKTVTKTPDINQSVNQSGQPSFSIIIIQNTPKINLNITQKHHTLSKTASIPNPLTTNRKKTHPTHIQRSADATPSPNTPQENSAPAAIQRSADGSPLPSDHHTSHLKNQNGQTASGTAAWSGPGASE